MQLNLFEQLNYHLTDDYEYSDDEIIEMIEAVEDYFAYHGLADNSGVNDTGILCESILDVFGTKS